MAPSEGCAVKLIAEAVHGGDGAIVGTGATVVGAAVVVGAADVVDGAIVVDVTVVVGATSVVATTVVVGGAADVADVELLSPHAVAASAITATSASREPNISLFYRDWKCSTGHVARHEWREETRLPF